MRHDSDTQHRLLGLVATTRESLELAILLAAEIAEQEVGWRLLLELDEIAHACLAELGMTDAGDTADRVADRDGLVDRVETDMMYAICAAKFCDEPRLAVRLLTNLAEQTRLVHERLCHCAMWEHDDRVEMLLN